MKRRDIGVAEAEAIRAKGEAEAEARRVVRDAESASMERLRELERRIEHAVRAELLLEALRHAKDAAEPADVQ